MKVLEEVVSPVNGQVRVVSNVGLGVYIQTDGLTQSGGVIKTVWKSTLKKVKLQKPGVGDSLILGLGGGSVAGMINRYWPESKITGVDIDPIMVSLGKKYLGLGKIGMKTKIEDAGDFVAQSKRKYDLIIVDTYKGYSFPEKFEDADFLKKVNKLLAGNGIVVFNRLYFDEYRKKAVKFGDKLETIFSKVEVVYPEVNIMFICLA